MRLNRGTILLLVISLVVIAGVLIVNNNNPAAGSTTPTPTLTTGGPLLPDMSADAVLSVKVTDNTSEGFTEVSRADSSSDWAISVPAGSEQPDRTVDQYLVKGDLDKLVGMQTETGFAADNLADFGLDKPAFTIEVGTADGSTVLQVGNKNPGNTRYYILLASDPSTVYLVQNASVEQLTGIAASPPYVPLPTATPTATATLNPMSEVEQATATAEMNLTVTSVLATSSAQLTATFEATQEATPAP